MDSDLSRTRYVTFTENNFERDEEWDFHIRYDGNEEELMVLEQDVKDIQHPYTRERVFRLDLDKKFYEYEADILVKHSKSGIMPFNIKLPYVLHYGPQIDIKIREECREILIRQIMANPGYLNLIVESPVKGFPEAITFLKFKFYNTVRYVQFEGNKKDLSEFAKMVNKHYGYKRFLYHFSISTLPIKSPPASETLIGRFNYFKSIEKLVKSRKPELVRKLLSCGNIQKFFIYQ